MQSVFKRKVSAHSNHSLFRLKQLETYLKDAKPDEVTELVKGLITYDQFKAKVIRRTKNPDYICIDDLNLNAKGTHMFHNCLPYRVLRGVQGVQ